MYGALIRQHSCAHHLIVAFSYSQAADSLNDDDGGGDHEISKDELAYVLSEPELGGDLANQMRKNFATISESFIARLFERLDRNKVCHGKTWRVYRKFN